MAGWTFNTLKDAPTDGPEISALGIVFTAVALIVVILRVYVRGFMVKAFGVDDGIIVATWFASCGFAVVTVIQTKWGLGLKKLDDMPAENYYNFLLLQFIGAPFYISSILGFKLSLLVSYLRFMAAGLWHKIRKQWDASVTGGSCIPAVPMYTTMASITIVFDVVVMLLPFPTLVQLRIANRKKIVLLGLFAMGTFISIIQIVRIQTIKSLTVLTDSGALIMWSTVENNLGIIVASIPTLAPLVRYFNEQSRIGSKSRGKSNGESGYVLQSSTFRNKLSRRSGVEALGSGIDQRDGASSDSEEQGIVRKTDITITSSDKVPDDEQVTPGRFHAM
ncbi:integral membrane [Fusarium albosuccineum]|uniref:Integral membrane n=1 Tax=Fusarium albosuccineum TaxID=1237068 RepID=A0A8H4LQR5_9HYPO|nr:integral membrane [Fusarium albosuccineum]